jgi:hypothetical protein
LQQRVDRLDTRLFKHELSKNDWMFPLLMAVMVGVWVVVIVIIVVT